MATKNKPQGGSDKVTSIHRSKPGKPGAIVPEPGWKPRGRYGVMRTPEGAELVALDDLVHWLADRDGLTMQQTVSRVLDALQPADLDCMYFTQYENLAADVDGVPDWARWDAMAGIDRELAAPVVGTGDGFEQFSDIAPLEPAQRLHLLRERARAEIWAVLLRDKPESEVIAASHISILATRAHKLYAWGSVAAVGSEASTPAEPADWSSLVAYRSAPEHARSDWTDAQCDILWRHEQAEKARRARGVREAMAKALDVSVPRIGQLIAKSPAKQAADTMAKPGRGARAA